MTSISQAANNAWTWTWNFTKSFFTFAGGPGNKPTCAYSSSLNTRSISSHFSPGRACGNNF